MLVAFSDIPVGAMFGSYLKPLGLYLRTDKVRDDQGYPLNAVLLGNRDPGTFRFFSKDDKVFCEEVNKN